MAAMLFDGQTRVKTRDDHVEIFADVHIPASNNKKINLFFDPFLSQNMAFLDALASLRPVLEIN